METHIAKRLLKMFMIIGNRENENIKHHVYIDINVMVSTI